VAIPADAAGEVTGPGTATSVEDLRAETQYVLPVSDPWVASFDGARLAMTALPAGAWLVAELGRGEGVARDGILRALPAGSALTRLEGLRNGVPEVVDLIVAHGFAEGALQPRERAEVEAFVRRGGSILLIFASRRIPAASERIWRELFGVGDAREKEVGGLPRGLLVSAGFTVHYDIPEPSEGPSFVWRRSGRGIVIAVALPPGGEGLGKVAQAEGLFRRVAKRVRDHCRPVRLGPVEPDVPRLFGPPEWSGPARRRLAWVAFAYAAGAIGLLVSAGAALSRRRLAWIGGAALLAAAGAGFVLIATAGPSGLALDTASVVVIERGVPAVRIDLARVARLGPGEPPELDSADRMPPKLVVGSRADTNARTWVRYRFRPHRATVQPLLGAKQYACLAWVGPAGRSPGGAAAPAPENADALIAFFERRWASAGAEYDYEWARAAGPPRPFAASAKEHFVQVRRGPVLIARRKTRAAEPSDERPSEEPGARGQ